MNNNITPLTYQKYVRNERRWKVLYVKVQALYDMLKNTFIFYEKVRGELELIEFTINP